MASAEGYSAGGDKTGSVDLPDGVFGIEPNPHVVWESVVNFQANQRHGTAKVKTRGEVARSNSKPWRQKGTGRARAGTWRSPIWIGGGRIHGPQPRDHSYRLPKKIRRLAIKSALSDRAKEGRVAVVDAVDVNEPAEVPTSSSAVRASKPVCSASAPTTPLCQGSPLGPPALNTTPIETIRAGYPAVPARRFRPVRIESRSG